jgi:nucleoside-diphosphate-sugar epimerase
MNDLGVPRDDLEAVGRRIGDRWLMLRDRRIFITGGTGFVGTWLLETLAWANREFDLRATAVVLTRNPASFAKKAPHLVADPLFHWHAGDVRTFEFPQGSCWGAIHAAFDSGVAAGAVSARQTVDTIFDGTRRVLEFARSCKAERLHFVSSGAVYGRQPPELSHVPETYLGAPVIDFAAAGSSYGEAKRLAEVMVLNEARESGLQASIARCFALVGPHLPLDGSFAAGNFLADVLARRPITVSGDGTPWRSYLYAADLAEWLWTMFLAAPTGTILNAGSEEAVQLGDLARKVAALGDPPSEVRVAKPADPTKPAERYIPSCRRAAELLDLRVHTPLDDALRKTYDWHQQRRA